MRWGALGLAVLAVRVSVCLGHPLAPALLEIREGADRDAAVTWKTGVLSVPGSPLQPVLPPHCRSLDSPVARPGANEASLITTWQIHCPDGLVGQPVGVTGLDAASTQALLRIVLADGRVVQRVLTATDPVLTVPPRPARLDVVRDYLRLGVEHILTGADHLLFVFGLLLLVSATRPLAFAITGFTLGHSITLSLAVLGLATVPAGPAELVIALSVLLLAVELARETSGPTLMRRFPWLIAGGFGLLHGLGFAGALREVGLPAGEVPLALGAFNAGIEVGQLAFVAAVIGAWMAVRRVPLTTPAWVASIPVYVMGSLAAYWSLQRAAALF